ncbi:MAG: restriction endonuclease subunit S [Porticoccaceae bacterium]|nr:restriction endonuclease subunit S [Porticoccaceae bacterium]
MSLQTVPLSNVCEIIMGQAPVGSSYNENGEGLALIAGAGDFGQTTPEPKKYTTQASKISKIDDLILCIRATIGDLNWSNKEYCLGRGVAGLRPIANVLDKNYLWHFIGANKNQLSAKGTGSTFKQVSRSHIDEWEIPLPPLAEQKRIAAILDKADAIRRKRQQAIQIADEFLRAVFLDMFGDIPARKSKYQFLGCRGYVSASSGKSSRDVFSEIPTEIPIYGGNGINGYATSSLYDEPVIVLGRVGQQCAITNLTSGPAWVTDNAIVVQVTDSGRYNPVYLAYAFMHSPIRDTVTRLDLPFINQSMILDAPIPLPPIELQNKFEKIREKTFQLIQGLTESAGETQSCFSALSQKAFSGEL